MGIPTADSVSTPFTILMNWQTPLKKWASVSAVLTSQPERSTWMT